MLFVCSLRKLSFSPWLDFPRRSILQGIVRIAWIGFEHYLGGACGAADVESVDRNGEVEFVGFLLSRVESGSLVDILAAPAWISLGLFAER